MDGDLAGMPLTLAPSAVPSDCAKLCAAREDCAAWSFGKADCLTAAPRTRVARAAVGTEIEPKCWLKSSVPKQSLNKCRVSGTSAHDLLPYAFAPLPLSTSQPTGWLQEQLKVQARGLSGHLALFWKDIEQSAWVGGDGDGGLHERTPYWLNGVVALAFQLENGPERTKMMGQVNKYIDYVLSHASGLSEVLRGGSGVVAAGAMVGVGRDGIDEREGLL